MLRMVAVGPPAVVGTFQALGLETMAAETPETARKILRSLEAGMEEGAIFTTDDLAAECLDEIADLRRNPKVAILTLPTPTRGNDPGEARHERIREMVRRAVGLDMLGERRL